MSKLILAEIIDKAKDQIVEKYADGMVEHVQSDDFKWLNLKCKFQRVIIRI